MSKIPRDGGESFADYAVVSLPCLRIHPEKSHREALDLLSEMPHTLAQIGIEEGDLLRHSTLIKAFEEVAMKTPRVLLCREPQLHDTADHAAVDATFFDREAAGEREAADQTPRVSIPSAPPGPTTDAVGADSAPNADDFSRPTSRRAPIPFLVAHRLKHRFRVSLKILQGTATTVLAANYYPSSRRYKHVTGRRTPITHMPRDTPHETDQPTGGTR